MSSPTDTLSHAAQNARGIMAMLASTAAFMVNDTLLKLAAERMPTGEAIFLRGIMASVLVLVAAYATGSMRGWRVAATPAMAWRTLGEIGGTVLYLNALFRMPIANATAILQIVPLVMTAVSAIFLGEQVGWRRWTAAAVGLVGAILIIQPGPEGFNAASLFALAAVTCIILRDLMTRQIGRDVPGLFITVVTALVVTLTGAAMAPFEHWIMPHTYELMLMAGSAVFLVAGYLTIIAAMRSGEVSVVTPFRYALIVWALLLGYFIWGDVPEPLMIVGIAIVVGAGIYTFHREARLKLPRRSYVRV